jgi:hypothetical protein
MTRETKIFLSVGVIIAGYFVYAKFLAAPKIELERLNWDSGEATVLVNGQEYNITENSEAILRNGYSVVFKKAIRPDTQIDSVARLELLHNGATKKVLAQF